MWTSCTLTFTLTVAALLSQPCYSARRKCKGDKGSLDNDTVAKLRAMWEERWFYDTSKFPKVQLTLAQQQWWDSLADYFPPGRITPFGGNVDQSDQSMAADLRRWEQKWFDKESCLTPNQQRECETKDSNTTPDSGRKKRVATTQDYDLTTIITLSPDELKAIEEANRIFGESWLLADPKKFPATNLTAAQRYYLDGIKLKWLKKEKDKKNKKKRDCDTIQLPAWTRMEWRRMAEIMRESFIQSIEKLASLYPDPKRKLSGYDIFVKMHRVHNSPGAQRGASLLPWHRELLWRFSNALRKLGYRGEIPYWDPVLDVDLPDPSCSALWSTYNLGVSRGDVGEPFTFLKPIKECGSKLTRKALKGNKARQLLFTKKKVEQVLAKTCYSHLTWGWDQEFESYNNDVHAFFGPMNDAQMADPNCAPTDPAFWLHIAYIDLIWEKYRQYEQQEKTRELEYPKNNVGKIPSAMYWWADMKPFGTNPNIHGLSDFYTRYYYSYEDHASFIECKSDIDCDRENTGLLWCYTKEKRCLAKIQKGCTCTEKWPDQQCWCAGSSEIPKCKKCVCTCTHRD